MKTPESQTLFDRYIGMTTAGVLVTSKDILDKKIDPNDVLVQYGSWSGHPWPQDKCHVTLQEQLDLVGLTLEQYLGQIK